MEGPSISSSPSPTTRKTGGSRKPSTAVSGGPWVPAQQDPVRLRRVESDGRSRCLEQRRHPLQIRLGPRCQRHASRSWWRRRAALRHDSGDRQQLGQGPAAVDDRNGNIVAWVNQSSGNYVNGVSQTAGSIASESGLGDSLWRIDEMHGASRCRSIWDFSTRYFDRETGLIIFPERAV